MIDRVLRRALSALAVLAALAGAARATEPPPYDPASLRWRSLDYRVSKFGLTVSSRIRLTPAAPGGSDRGAPRIDDGSTWPSSEDRGMVLHMETRGLRREGNLDLWFDPRSGRALERTQIETGSRLKRYRYRRMRFVTDGIHSEIRKPTEGELGLSHEAWSRRSESFIPFPAGCCSAVGTPSLLFYLLSVVDLSKPGDRVRVQMVSKSRLMAVDLIAEKLETVRVSYLEESPEGSREVEGRVEGIEILLVGQPVTGESGDRGFEFLGLRGDVRVVLDRTLRVPLRISGSIRYAGRGHVKLQRVAMRSP